MKLPESVQNVWNRLPKLPRKWRIIRNLAVLPVLLVFALDLLEWPSLSAYGAFHRLESSYLLTPSRLVLQLGRNRTTVCLSEGESWITMGSVMEYDSGGKPLDIDKFRAILHYVLPKEGTVVVPIPAADEDDCIYAAVWGGPEEAVSGTLELELASFENFIGEQTSRPETCTAQAERRENGWFIFQFAPHENHRNPDACAIRLFPWWTFSPGDRLENNYQLTLFDVNGKQIAAQSGITPPDQMLMQW